MFLIPPCFVLFFAYISGNFEVMLCLNISIVAFLTYAYVYNDIRDLCSFVFA